MMKETKFWTINCKILNDDEFQLLTKDIENYILTLGGNWRLPQEGSKNWLNQFVDNYAKWPQRQFRLNRYPLHNYFEISKRVSLNG